MQSLAFAFQISLFQNQTSTCVEHRLLFSSKSKTTTRMTHMACLLPREFNGTHSRGATKSPDLPVANRRERHKL